VSDRLPPIPEYQFLPEHPSPGIQVELLPGDELPPRPRPRRRLSRLAIGLIAGIGGAAVIAAGVVAGLILFPPAPPPEEQLALGPFEVPETNPSFQPRELFDRQAHSIDDAKSVWVVVNKHRPLDPKEYVPELTAVSLPGYQGQMRPEAAEALREMFAAFSSEVGGQLSVVSPYRSYLDQVGVYNGWVSRLGQAQADRQSARPGFSEHQTGLSVDINTATDQGFGDTAAGRWLARYSWRYGFIVRYPEGKESVTGYFYEPWHFRYVGVDLATEMHDQGITTLEEFFDLEDAPTYP